MGSSEFNEIDALLNIVYENYCEAYSRAYAEEKEDGTIVTKDGEILYAPMDKCVAILLGFYGTSLEDIKADIDELNSEGFSPVKKLILPQPKVLGLDLEFDAEVKFPEVE